MERLVSFFGLFALLFIAYCLSTNRKKVSWRLVVMGTALQLVLAVLVLKTPAGRAFFAWMGEVFSAVMAFGQEGSSFVFGNLIHANIPVGTPHGGAEMADADLLLKPDLWAKPAANFAFGVLPIVIFFSALMAVLYHLGVMHWLVYGIALIMKVTLRTSGAESLSSAANIFVGQTEAPLVIKPYLKNMTTSELHAIMVGGMATIAGSVMAAYVAMLSGRFPDIAGHLMAASIMSAPASLVLAKILVPETEIPESSGSMSLSHQKIDANVFEAASRGASEGWLLVMNIAAMLIAFIGLIAFGNKLWGLSCYGITSLTGFDLSAIDTLQELGGYVFYPFAWLMGVPPEDCLVAGKLLGERTVLNEFVAYVHMSDYLNGKPLADGLPVHELSERTKVILAYALCGFANFSSIGILIGGMGGLAPERRKDIAKLGWRALVGGTFASFMTANIAGMLI